MLVWQPGVGLPTRAPEAEAILSAGGEGYRVSYNADVLASAPHASLPTPKQLPRCRGGHDGDVGVGVLWSGGVCGYQPALPALECNGFHGAAEACVEGILKSAPGERDSQRMQRIGEELKRMNATIFASALQQRECRETRF
jgi:hypothetical protein